MLALWALGAWLLAATASAADLEEAEDSLRKGRYDECARMAEEVIGARTRDPRWAHLKIEAELARGKYPEAATTLEEALERYPTSFGLHLLGRQVYRANGREDEAVGEMKAIETILREAPRRFLTLEMRLVLGRFFLLRGADAKQVLDQFYDVVTKEQPELVEVYLASAELALDKQDNALASATLAKAPKDAAEEPKYHFLLATALSNEDRARSEKALDDALKINPSHADSLLLRVDHLIDSERYAEAEDLLKRVLEVNPKEPRAWAYRAVLAHLRNDPEGEAAARASALSPWATNPEVDHLIGRELSQKYRFAEGSAAQRRALELDAQYAPAKVQLCNDLLRLGDEAEGWTLAGEIFAKDGYNVLAYNLITLRDRLAGFRTLESDGFLVRMDPREADLYGERVLALLRRAKETLCKAYEVTLKEPVIVEIFPQKKEFAVRTFGLPGADGFLGVCFGRLITANSPASQGETPSNWEAVLWHEFCHVVTLTKTHNKMPRWLSEGISVYEESRQDPAWGMPMDPRFRAMILGDSLTPLSKLSSAFLAPKTPHHLQFAYYESAMAAGFLVERFGLPSLKGLLDDLGAGTAMNDALPLRTKTSLVQLDRDFAEYARKKAQAVAPGATWEEPELPQDADSKALSTWVEAHPKSFWGWKRLGARFVAEENWLRARHALEKVKELFPEYVGPENAYMLLAVVARKTADTGAERPALETLAARDGNAGPAYLRLMELDEASGDWKGVAKNARRLLAVNPLIPAPHRALARAEEVLGGREAAVAAYRALALLDETDPAELHFRLAKLLRDAGKPAEARREVLKSLEEAPRFLDAHRLLLELAGPDSPPPPAPTPASILPPPPPAPPGSQGAKP